jgi:site-specific DNA recombinase
MRAEYERAKIIERHRRGKLHAARSGSVNVMGGAPYGYRYISKYEGGGQARYEIHPEEARVVRQVLDWVGHERLTIGEVCRRLRRAGERTRMGRTVWDRSGAPQPRHPPADYDVPPENWLLIPVPALVDPAVFATVQEQLQENRRHARHSRRGARYLLQGLRCTARQ